MTTGTKVALGCVGALVLAALVAATAFGVWWLVVGRTPLAPSSPQAEATPADSEPGTRTAGAASPAPSEPEAPGSDSGADRFVLIDRSDPAYLVLVLVPAARLDEARARAGDGSAGIELVGLQALRRGADVHLRARILQDEYPRYRVVEGLLAAIMANEGVPVGLTWNGGIAITGGDYAHAKRAFERWQSDPAAWERSRPQDARSDPLDPGGHFEALLGERYLAGDSP